MNHSELNRKFRTTIEGKRVVFVGTSIINIDTDEGENIDSFDLVVRTNNSINLLDKEDFRKDYGTRLDILYVNNQFKRHTPDLIFHPRLESLKWLCFKAIDEISLNQYNDVVDSRTILELILEVVKHCNTATMGNLLWYDILLNDPAELYLSGVDFFVNRKKVLEPGDYSEYYPGYIPDTIQLWADQKREESGNYTDQHNNLDNARFTDLLRNNFPNFKMDKGIHNLLDDILTGKVGQRD